MENQNDHGDIGSSASGQPKLEAQHDARQTEIYSLSAEKLSRNEQKIERRQFKDRISDRRSEMRLNADGEPQADRRKTNRIANAEMFIRLQQAQ